MLDAAWLTFVDEVVLARQQMVFMEGSAVLRAPGRVAQAFFPIHDW